VDDEIGHPLRAGLVRRAVKSGRLQAEVSGPLKRKFRRESRRHPGVGEVVGHGLVGWMNSLELKRARHRVGNRAG